MVDGPDGICQSHEAKARLKLNVSGIKLNVSGIKLNVSGIKLNKN